MVQATSPRIVAKAQYWAFLFALAFAIPATQAGLFGGGKKKQAPQAPEAPALPTTGTYTFSETFAGPAAGASLRANWECEFGWEWKNDALRHDLGGKQFAVLKTAPYGESVEVEATLTVTGSTGTSWKIAGVSVYWDKQNYWHLAFVQSPAEKGAQHLVELSEMCENKWLSHQKLKKLDLPELPSFAWQKDHPYRLQIVMGSGQIRGTISEVDGTPRWHAGYEFSAPAVIKGRPALDNGGMHAQFRDFRGSVTRIVPPPTEEEPTFPPYAVKASKILNGTQTGYFHTEKKRGKWWIIDPNGDAFWAVATDHCNYRAHWCQALGYAPHHKKMEKKYGSEEAWAESATERLQKWGFNTLGAGCHKPTYYKGLAHTAFVSLGGHFCHLGAEYRISYPEDEKPTPCSYFPNVFHPRFAEFCDFRASQMCSPKRNDPWLIGYFLDNELKWWGQTWNNAYGLFEDTMDKPATHTAKIALVDFLKGRYSSIAAFNKAWGADIASFDCILSLEDLTGENTERVEEDKTDFVRVIVDRYFRIGTEAIRRHDPNHMTLGCRFAGLNNPAYVPAWEAAGKYCDIVTTNVYEKVDLETGETYSMYKGKRVPLRDRFEAVNKIAGGAPFWVTEWSYPSYDSGLPCKHGAGQRVNTQAERTFAFEAFQKGLFGLPFMVGSSFFMWVDEPALGISEWFPEDSNYGLVNEDDEPYELLTNACTKLNPSVYDVHAGDTAELAVRNGRKPGSFVIKNSGKAAAECSVTIWTDGREERSTLTIKPRRSVKVNANASQLAKPGGHYVCCEAAVSAPGIEVALSDNRAEKTLYTPGMPCCRQSGAACIPIVFTNPSAAQSEPAPLVLKTAEIPAGIDWSGNVDIRVAEETAQARSVPFQIDPCADTSELAILVPSIAPHSAVTMMICSGGASPAPALSSNVSYTKTAQGFEISNGRLKLVTSNNDGTLFDRIELDGVQLGRYYPMVHQALPQNMWTAPDKLESVDVSNGPVRLVLTAVLSKTGASGEVKTAVGKDGTFAEAKQSPATYRTTCRICVYPDRPWFTAQGVDVTNTDSRTWELKNYFHYAPSNIAGDAKDDEAMRSRWYDPKAELAYGAIDPAKNFNIHFWLDNGGGQHPDARRAVNVELAPGQVHREPEAVLYIGGTKGDANDAWTAFKQSVTTAGSISYKVYPKP